MTNPGIYVIQCVLNLAEGHPAGTVFSIFVNNTTLAAPAATRLSAGPIMIFRVADYGVNATVRIVNNSNHNVSIIEGEGIGGSNLGSAGHCIFYRIADRGVT